ncbi:hypothetical protein [Halopelagius fulvigenes]|uniref:Small CPxCG-related zinc finger protein n=1 Tax=Halopelagius fulvigenes TaxID=1198324 RepID=A0ABD5U2F8_9EURY
MSNGPATPHRCPDCGAFYEPEPDGEDECCPNECNCPEDEDA